MGPAGTPASCSLVFLAPEASVTRALLPSTCPRALLPHVIPSRLLALRCMVDTHSSRRGLSCTQAFTEAVPPTRMYTHPFGTWTRQHTVSSMSSRLLQGVLAPSPSPAS